MIDWLYGLLGGLLIGGGAALLLRANGRVAGISGILGEALGGRQLGTGAPFLLGLIAAPLIRALVAGAPAIVLEAPTAFLVVGGLLVGIGTRTGNGCTSGHGVCGLSRLSLRSMAATGTFMAVAAVTVFVMRHLAGGV